MNCDCCDQKATVFLTQIKGDKMQKINLCEECSRKQGVTDPTGFALADLLTGIGSEKPVRRAKPNDLACPECGFTLTDFKKTGRLGCPTCYEVFRENIMSLLGSMHRGTRHAGKVPSRFSPETPTAALLEALNDELELAVAAENYEKAAQLRDQIARLKEKADPSREAAPRRTR